MEVDDLPAAFGRVVRELRQSQGVSQERLATLAGIDRAYMGGLERGVRNPSLTMMARVSSGLGMALSEVLRLIEQQP